MLYLPHLPPLNVIEFAFSFLRLALSFSPGQVDDEHVSFPDDWFVDKIVPLLA